jgi:hypothetical protein
MVISPKQARIAETIRLRQANQIFLIGSLGTSKTFGAAVAMLSVALQYPGSLLVVARKNLTELRTGTLLSFHEAAEAMHLTAFRQTDSPILQWELENRSLIIFKELDHTKDRQFAKIKSINATAAMIDEADGVVREAHIALFSRTGRHNQNGAPAFILDTCNPNEGWIKEDVYDPWTKDEMGSEKAVIEFEPSDSFLGAPYYARFENMPLAWKKRYLWNDWNYGDDDTSLFKYRHMDRQTVDTFPPALRYAGDDVARSGKDRSVIAMWEGATLVEIVIVKDKEEVVDTADQAETLKDYATTNLIGYENISVDAVGIGVGVVDHAKKLDMYVHEFMSGAASTETVTVKDKSGNSTEVATYTNLRSQVAHQLARDLENADAFLYSGCPFLSDFKKEATMHNYETKERTLGLEPKDKVKERLGHSPDIFDAVLMGYERVLAAGRGGGAVPSVGGSYEGMYGQRRGRSGLMSV